MLKSLTICINECPQILSERLNSLIHGFLTQFCPCFSQPICQVINTPYLHFVGPFSNIDQIPKSMGFRSGLFRGQLSGFNKVASSGKFTSNKLGILRYGNETKDQLNCVNANMYTIEIVVNVHFRFDFFKIYFFLGGKSN